MVCNEFNWDTKIPPQMWTKECKYAWKFAIEAITSDPALVCWDSRKQRYIQTDYSNLGMEFVGMQPANDAVSLAAMLREVDGGPCELMRDPPKDDPTKLMAQV